MEGLLGPRTSEHGAILEGKPRQGRRQAWALRSHQVCPCLERAAASPGSTKPLGGPIFYNGRGKFMLYGAIGWAHILQGTKAEASPGPTKPLSGLIFCKGRGKPRLYTKRLGGLILFAGPGQAQALSHWVGSYFTMAEASPGST